MLLGSEIHIYTNHKNILSIGDSSGRRLRWISYVDEYGPTLHYIEGPYNVIADTFSWVSCSDPVSSALVGKKVPSDVSDLNNDTEYLSLMDDQEMFTTFSNLPAFLSHDDETNRPNKRRKTQNKNDMLDPNYEHTHSCLSQPSSSLYNDTCYLNLPENMVQNNPLDFDNIKEKQDADVDIQDLLRKYP